VIFLNVTAAICRAPSAFAVVIGEFTMASPLNRPAFGPNGWWRQLRPRRDCIPRDLGPMGLSGGYRNAGSRRARPSRTADASAPDHPKNYASTASWPSLKSPPQKVFGSQTAVHDFAMDTSAASRHFLGPGLRTILRMLAGFNPWPA
jgi:hypothetical protein